MARLSLDILFPLDELSITSRNRSDLYEYIVRLIKQLKATYQETARVVNLNDYFLGTPGRKLWIYENTAPNGWSIVSACADSILGVKGGTAAYNVSGGGTGGTWTQPNHKHAGPSHTHDLGNHTHAGPSHTHDLGNHTHTTPDHTLTEAEIPAHKHGFDHNIIGNNFTSSIAVGTGYYTGNEGYSYTNNTGGGGSHNHGATGVPSTNTSGSGGTGATGAPSTNTSGSGGTGDTSDSATANTYRPLASVGIVIQKD